MMMSVPGFVVCGLFRALLSPSLQFEYLCHRFLQLLYDIHQTDHKLAACMFQAGNFFPVVHFLHTRFCQRLQLFFFLLKPEVEDKARLYYRTFAREFYDVCEGRVSDEEFFDLWEREEELKAGLNSINSLEGEQKQLEKELVHANEDETMMNGKIKAVQEKRRNKKALFISFLCMAAAVCGVSAGYLYHFEMNAKDYLWQLSAGAVIILLLLVILFQSQRKAGDQLKLLEMMVTHKSYTGKRLEDDKREIGNDLKFYYEKFEKVFSYISPEQWKLFDFCGKVSARLRFSDAILEASNDLERLLEKNQWDNPGIWMYHPKVLYDLIKRKDYLNTLNDRKDICNQELIRHEQILEGIGEQADSETIE